MSHHLKVSGKGGKTRYLPLHPGTNGDPLVPNEVFRPWPRQFPASFAQPPYDKSILVLVSPLILVALAGTMLM